VVTSNSDGVDGLLLKDEFDDNERVVDVSSWLGSHGKRIHWLPDDVEMFRKARSSTSFSKERTLLR
jgi:hypothetical protein